MQSTCYKICSTPGVKKPRQHTLSGPRVAATTKEHSGDEPARYHPGRGIVYRCTPLYTPRMATLAHLLDPDFTPLLQAEVGALLNAQAKTTLVDFNDNADVLADLDRSAAQAAFAAVTSPTATHDSQIQAVTALRVPPAVKHLAGMLSQYDWAFVEQAKEIRGYVVAELLEMTKSPDPKVKLRALELTGKLTEVGSFTERIAVTKTDASSSELEDRIRKRLATLIPAPREVQDAKIVDAPPPPADFQPPAA